MVESKLTHCHSEQCENNEINGILSEIANLVWGGFKVRYVAENDENKLHESVQIPIVVDYDEHKISFGSDAPQLSFKYTVFDEKTSKQIEIFQRLIFHLQWTPELFTENTQLLDDLLDSGELEFF